MSARRGTHLSNRPSYKEFVEKHPRLAERLKEKRHFGRDRHPADRWEDIRDRKEDFCDKREDIRDRLEDVRDRREDIRDRRHRGGRLDRLEDIRDRREDVQD
ncbi:MAG: hypothetical protein Q6354_04680, partial [Candidatus Brocadiales bacterium]|nr:hypothetical protein [Candidatus Brocadiales bacterium]